MTDDLTPLGVDPTEQPQGIPPETAAAIRGGAVCLVLPTGTGKRMLGDNPTTAKEMKELFPNASGICGGKPELSPEQRELADAAILGPTRAFRMKRDPAYKAKCQAELKDLLDLLSVNPYMQDSFEQVLLEMAKYTTHPEEYMKDIAETSIRNHSMICRDADADEIDAFLTVLEQCEQYGDRDEAV